MAKICILSALLLQLLYTSVQGQSSPCPDRFTYIKKPGSDETIGQIEIRNPPKNNFELHLKVDFKVATQLPGSFVGGVDLTKSKEDAARDVLEGRPLLYHITFPVQNPLPAVHRMWFNNEQICSGPEVSGNVVTTITLDHTLKIIIQHAQNQPNPPPQNRPAEQKPTVSLSHGISNNIFLHPNKQKPISQHSSNPFFSQTAPPRNTNTYISNPFLRPNAPPLTPAPKVDNKVNSHTEYIRPSNPSSGGNPFLSPFTPRPPQQTPQPAPRPAPRPIPQPASRPIPQPVPPGVIKIENYNECGISSSTGSPNPLISNGKKTLPGQWPWLAAIFRVIHNYEYLCGGTILTTKHILTAGHCLKTSAFTNETIPANILSVALGRYRLQDFNEAGSVNMNVARYISHPEYMHVATGDSDLAILILSSPVEFTAFIRPICLPSSIDSHRLQQKEGIVVGWGEDEHGNPYTEEPRLANMPIVQTDVCLRSHQSFFFITSDRTFCAGWLNHNGPCNGDSGSGLVVLDPVTNRYQLRGIVSRTLRGQQPFCDLTQYVVFVDVFKYLTWINQQKYST